ncbi:MAG: DUF4252 domain-containing protein [Bacteroidales bacterium]|jgi:hypothetical protein|nr:DUF4252 domain-containing protein [Bacteroidales bacterium]MDD3664254.1 DUF4252 domain-containing protein [Bacteroidales bacterium]
MNKLKMAIIATLLLTVSALNAQNIMDKLFDKYNGKDGYATVNISPEMFKMFANMEIKDEKKNEATELINAASKLTGLKVITVSRDSASPAASDKRANDLFNEVKPMIGTAYTMLMEVNDNKEKVLVYTRRSGKIVSEVIVLVRDTHSTVFMSITGDVDLEQIGRLTSKMNIHGAEKIKKGKSEKKK